MKPLLLLGVLLLSGCGTVGTIAPAPIVSKAIAYDGNTQDAGFLGYLSNGSAHITQHAKDKYTTLLGAGYAKGLVLPVPGPADGLQALPDGTWTIDREHLELFARMNILFNSKIKLK